MHVHLIHHASDAEFAGALSEAMAAHRLDRHASASGSDVVLVLASRLALKDGLGDGPAKAMAAGVPVLTTVLGDGVLPPRFPVANKHVPLVRDVASALRLLEDHRKNAAAHIADGKRELFAHGLFLALLARA